MKIFKFKNHLITIILFASCFPEFLNAQSGLENVITKQRNVVDSLISEQSRNVGKHNSGSAPLLEKDSLFGPQNVLTRHADLSGVTDIAYSDLDGDNDIDIVAASRERGLVGWYRNDGDGIFGEIQIITTETKDVMSISVNDLNGDGDPDIMSASYEDDKVAWYENEGNGSFGDQKIISTESDGPWLVYSSDLDGDGDMDVLSSAHDDKVVWYENNGNGTFGVPQIVTTKVKIAHSVYTADLDGDGDLDVLTASLNSDVIDWYENDGNGAFGEQKIISRTGGFSSKTVYSSDMDGDGDMDVVYTLSFNHAGSGENKIAWFANDGTGNFGEESVISTEKASRVHTADFDDDGDLDLVAVSGYSVVLFEGLGSGTFGPKQLVSTHPYTPFTAYFVDLNNDDQSDILAANVISDKVFWLKSDSTGSFIEQEAISVQAEANGARAVCAGDLDGDGDVDIISGSMYDGKIAWYENQGNGMFGMQQIIDVVATGGFNTIDKISTADLDGDGNLDVLAVFPEKDSYHWSVSSTSRLAWYKNEGDGTFGDSQTIVSGVWGLESYFTADLNGDEGLDIIYSLRREGKIVWLNNDGTGNFEEPKIINSGTDALIAIDGADLDGDGDIDVLANASSGTIEAETTLSVEWYQNDGTGDFSEKKTVYSVSDDDLFFEPYVLASDLDNDGDMDFVSASPSTSTITWHENDATGNFVDLKNFSIDIHPNNISATDFDSDGNIDLLLGSRLSWLRNEGGGTFGNLKPIGLEQEERVFSTQSADLDGDGDQDVLAASSLNDKIVWYENLSTNTSLEESKIPERVVLKQNYPNPFNPSTVIRYELPAVTDVRLSVYNTLGQQVATVVNRLQQAGSYEVTFDASDLANGVYIYQLQAGSSVITRKMILLK